MSSQSRSFSFMARSMFGRVTSSVRQFERIRCPCTPPWCQSPLRPASLDCLFMSNEPPATPPAQTVEATEAPSAKQVPSQRTFHADTVTDESAWLADKSDPDTI